MRTTLEKIRFETPWIRVLCAALGTALMRFPFFSFQIAAANLQEKSIFWNHFEIPCISDCRIYGQLATGFDESGHYRWTYFPVWPRLIGLVRDILPGDLAGSTVAVTLSWLTGLIAGILILWFFDRYWQGKDRLFGFAKRAWIILFLFSIYPHGHFWFQGYSEPLFMIVLMLGLLSALSENLVLAGFLIGISAVVRPQGVWLPPVWAALIGWRAYKGSVSWPKAIISIALSGIGGIGLVAWYWMGTGDPLHYYKIQATFGYGRTFSLLGGIWEHRPRFDTAVLYLYLSITGSVQLIRRKDFPSRLLGWISLIFTEVPLFFGGFYSYVRFLSVTPALFIFLTDQYERSRFREAVIVLFFVTKLAIQVYKSGFHQWAG